MFSPPPASVVSPSAPAALLAERVDLGARAAPRVFDFYLGKQGSAAMPRGLESSLEQAFVNIVHGTCFSV